MPAAGDRSRFAQESSVFLSREYMVVSLHMGYHFLTVEAIRETGLRSLAMVCLIILVVAIIPACHKLDKRWRDLSESDAHDRALASAYRRDRILLWLVAIGLPFALTLLFRAMA